MDQLYLDDTSTAEVYPFTYTAPDDNAGNLGQSVAINVIVKDDETGATILNSSIITIMPHNHFLM